ncbi:unnamed protein product [Penicillium manginii]
MANFQHPFQCLNYTKQQSSSSAGFLIASAGRRLYSYAAANGQCLDVWPKTVQSSSESASEDQVPAEKRRKLSTAPDDQNEESKEKPSTKKAPGNQLPEWTNIPILLTSSDGKHVVAVTADDKCIRVFSLSEDGKLDEISSRTMPKRPSALALTPDGQTILCADKFGDAYSLPLIPGEYIAPAEEAKTFKPAATNLTVHSQRNLQTLKNQITQFEREAQKAASKDGNTDENVASGFEHQLILGHVSLLTDLIAVSLPTDAPVNRNYILTADRDEHIRVSRGLPHSHVIEKYCLGHTSFINKLCVPSWAPQYLISGGGDDFLLLWKWYEGKALQKVTLEGLSQESEISVRGIWAVSVEQPAGSPVQAILVGLEGSSTLLCYTIEEETLKHQDTIQLSGNILDLTGLDSRGSIVVSVDNIRESGSTGAWKSGLEAPQTLLEYFQVTTGQGSLKWNSAGDPLAANINAAGTSAIATDVDDKQKKALDGVLYSGGVLRKKQFGEYQ